MAVNFKADYDNSPIEPGDLGESSLPSNLNEEAAVGGSAMTTDSFNAENEKDEDCPVESDRHGESSISTNINEESKPDVGILSKRPIPALTTSTSNQSKPKKARTAYFIFASYKREEAKKAVSFACTSCKEKTEIFLPAVSLFRSSFYTEESGERRHRNRQNHRYNVVFHIHI
mmetsp:Transcript_41223/g.80670  ORF Transcript_41223/g.80670 Transcript_41223/m.80670 type:complete len:173 (+) Transcript_41223:162-680(+)